MTIHVKDNQILFQAYWNRLTRIKKNTSVPNNKLKLPVMMQFKITAFCIAGAQILPGKVKLLWVNNFNIFINVNHFA